MPEQRSDRGAGITTAAIQAPFETTLVRMGVRGLNLKDELDVIPPDQAPRLTDLDHDSQGAITARPGQTTFATGGSEHHSVRRLRQPRTGLETRFWGVDGSLYRATSGALGAAIDTGYSGDPLSLIPDHPPLSGEPWMIVGDRFKMRKVRHDGLVLPLGLPAPAAAATGVLASEYRRTICNFDASDGTMASTWIGVAGTDADGNPAGTPTSVDVGGGPSGTNAVYYTTAPGNIQGTYDSWWGRTFVLNLTQIDDTGSGGSAVVTDDDFIHLWMKTSHPHLIQELRIYFVVSALFNASVLPGTPDSSGAFANTDAYVKAFRQNDFVQFIQAAQTQVEAAETARLRAIRDQDQIDRTIVDDRASWAAARAAVDPGRARSFQIGTGGQQWFELGAIGLPMRRGDFQRIGSSTGRDWSTITGLIIYVKTDINEASHAVALAMDDCYLTGGFGPDTAQPGAQPYDVRYTHYDPRTGAEGNGSPVMAVTTRIDTLRRRITWTPGASTDSAHRQRFYRRGGSQISDWLFLGTNTSNGGTFLDTLSDASTTAAGAIPIDHFQPFPTVDDAGTTILAQPLPALWGPIDGMILGCGDPYRPGHLYWTLPDKPDHASASSHKEICPPSEQLMNGGLLGHQAFVFSRERFYFLYPSLSGAATIDYAPSLCKRGIKTRWAFTVGPGGVYFVAEKEGIFLTSGGPEEWISRDIDPLFQGQTRYGYLPIDWAAEDALRLTVWENKLYFLYQDTSGQRQVLVYSILNQFWRHAHFGRACSMVQGEDEPDLLLGSLNLGKTYTHTGTSDDGLAISPVFRSGSQSGGRREEKLFGDQIIDADRQGVDLTIQNFLNEETVTNLTQTLSDGTGRQRYILDAFGTAPQKGRSIATQISWTSSTAAPIIYQLGYALVAQPEITNRRVTQWDDLGSADESWVMGITLDVDTGNAAKSFVIERDFDGVVSTIGPFTVTGNGRHKVSFSWPGVPARQVRIRPDSEACQFWVLYRADWISQAEPPRIATWDIFFENAWDQYYTGLDLYCDTGGLEKRIVVTVDGTPLVNDLAGGIGYWPVVANGRKVVHLTFTAGRGHVFRFTATDANPGLLYSHRWQLDAEPSEQANWNQNFSALGSRADKYLKAILFECDTFDQTKNIRVEADGAVVEILPVRANGRKVVQIALTQQALGRVWRMYPADGNPGRLYSAQPVFDEEPFQLNRWETQESNYGLSGWFYPTTAQIVLKSTRAVTLTLSRQFNQRGGTKTEAYEIPATGGIKLRHFQSFLAGKDVLHKWVLTSPAAFYLYREETVVQVQPWGAADPIPVKPFGNDDMDLTRSMTNSAIAAETSGGAASAAFSRAIQSTR
jgi:hypothetical protein